MKLRGFSVVCANVCLLAFVLLSQPAPVLAATLTVTSLADSGPGSLRDAISTASPGDTIVFAVTGTIVLTSGQLSVNEDVTISGPGAESLAISGNHASRVFDIDGTVALTISNLTIENGNGVGFGIVTGGAGILNYEGTLTVINSTFSGNSEYLGGAIRNYQGTLTVINSTFSGNSAKRDSGADGGGILNDQGTATVTSSTFSSNSSDGGGGGIANTTGTLAVINSTFSGNSARSGGGISSGGTLTVINSTFSGNSAATFPFNLGGGIWIFGNATLKNTLLAKSPSGGNCSISSFGGLISQGHNLSDDGTCAVSLTQTGDLNNTPAGLDPSGLTNNGGPTQTIALLATSPAVDAIPVSPVDYCADLAGNPVTTDQRGVARPKGPACDIGAFEWFVAPDLPTTVAVSSPLPNTYGWNNTNVTLVLTAAENAGGSGVKSITYSLTGAQTGGGTVLASSTSFLISAEGVTTVTFYATDNAGNVEAVKTITVKIDTTPPIITAVAAQTLEATSSAGAIATFALSATDTGSGLASLTSSPASGSIFPLGTTVGTITATDKAANVSTKTFTVTVSNVLGTMSGATITNTSWNSFQIPTGAGPIVWVHAHIGKPNGVPTNTISMGFFREITLTLNGTPYALSNGLVTFDPAAPSTITTTYNTSSDRWETRVNPNNLSDEIFFTGTAIPVTAAIANGAKATLTYNVDSSVPNLSFPWQWSAAVYTFWPANWNDAQIQAYHASYHAGTPLNKTVQQSLIQGPRGGGGSNFTGSWSATGNVATSPQNCSGSIAQTCQLPGTQTCQSVCTVTYSPAGCNLVPPDPEQPPCTPVATCAPLCTPDPGTCSITKASCTAANASTNCPAQLTCP